MSLVGGGVPSPVYNRHQASDSCIFPLGSEYCVHAFQCNWRSPENFIKAKPDNRRAIYGQCTLAGVIVHQIFRVSPLFRAVHPVFSGPGESVWWLWSCINREKCTQAICPLVLPPQRYNKAKSIITNSPPPPPTLVIVQDLVTPCSSSRTQSHQWWLIELSIYRILIKNLIILLVGVRVGGFILNFSISAL